MENSALNTVTSNLVDLLMQRLAARFWHPQWEGPFLQTPEQNAEMLALHGYTDDPCWEVFVLQRARKSRDLDDTSMNGVVRAAIGFATVDQLLSNTEEDLAYRLTLAIAAQAAHEALEWVRFDGELVIDPHGSAEAIDRALDGIIGYFETAAR